MSERGKLVPAQGEPAAYSLDDLLCAIGELGQFQLALFCLVPLVGVADGLNALAQVFTAAETEHWCRAAAWDQAPCPGLDDWHCLVAKRNASIPSNASTQAFDSCRMYDVQGVAFVPGADVSHSTNETIIECTDGWVYDTRQYQSTIVTEFDLVCDKRASVSLSQSIYFAGFLVGSVVFGSLADRIGRKPSIFIACALLLVTSLGNVFAPSVGAYMTLRFFTGAGVMGAFLVAYVLVTEFIGPNQRALIGVSIQGFFALGITILPLLAYFIRSWRFLQLVISLPTALYFLLYCYVPESARWQIAKGKYAEAERTLRKVAAVNGKEFPEEMANIESMGARSAESEESQTALGLFRTPNMCLKTLNLMFNWFVNNMVYYGLGLSTSDLGVDDYLASAIVAVVEFPSIVYCVVALRYSGRRINLSGTMVIGGVACVVTAFLEMGITRTLIAMVGKFCISASFAIIYVVSGEIFPTPVRSAGVGLASMSARVSGILSPFVLELRTLWEPLPFLLFGLLAVAAGLLVLFLPETRGKRLPETLAEGEEFGKPRCFGGRGIDGSEGAAMATDAEPSPGGRGEPTGGESTPGAETRPCWRRLEGLAVLYEDVWGPNMTRLG